MRFCIRKSFSTSKIESLTVSTLTFLNQKKKYWYHKITRTFVLKIGTFKSQIRVLLSKIIFGHKKSNLWFQKIMFLLISRILGGGGGGVTRKLFIDIENWISVMQILFSDIKKNYTSMYFYIKYCTFLYQIIEFLKINKKSFIDIIK